MSRNIRRKLPVKPARPRKRRDSDSSSSLDLSDDGGYSAVEDISDSEDDDEDDVNAVEEESILAEGSKKLSAAPRPRLDVDDDRDLEDDDDDEDAEDADEEEEEDEDDEDEEEQEDDDDQEAGEDEDEEEDEELASIEIDAGDVDDNASWGGIVSEADDSQASDSYPEANRVASEIAVERHVRFDVPDSDSDSTETEDDHADLFPDIFVSQTALDPAFRREIEHDPDESSGSGSFWDYHGQYEEDDSDSETEEIIRRLSDDEAPMTVLGESEADNGIANFTPAFEEPLELDGYETDGDTTDEEDIPEPIIQKKARRPSTAVSEVSDSEMDSPVKSQRGQPRVGRFRLDRSDKKPIAVLNPITKKMMIFTPHRRRQLDLSPEQFNFPWSIEEQQSPILSNSANMMLSAMFSTNTFGDFVNANTVGPAEAFFPFPSEANTADESPSSPSLQGDEDEDEGKLDISDFITWGEEAANSSEDEATNDDWEKSAPRRPSTAHGERDVLSHLTSDTVGAFRRNQINQQLILSNQATHDSLAFSGPYNFTALRGLRSDRFDTAGVPLTPIRRHKRSTTESTRSPVELLSAKRKAPGETNINRKRARSLSEVNYLRL